MRIITFKFLFSFLALSFISLFIFSTEARAQTVELWSNPSTWNGAIPTADTEVVIGEGKTVQFDVSQANVKSIYVDHGGSLIFKDQNFSLSTRWIVVHGTLQIGTSASPFASRGVITFVGTDSTENALPFMGTKGILVHGGVLELQGKVSNTSWTRINQTASRGSSSIVLEKTVDWKVGDKIVIASTDFDPRQAEELTVTGVNGSTISFTPPLRYSHFGEKQYFDGKELDERAEVGLLTRNILIQGGEDSEIEGFGAHIMAMRESTLHINGVELYRVGQKLGNRGILGRYGVHFHLGGDVSGSYVKNTSIHHTFNRCITIHGTDYWTLTDNVCYDSIGHMYFFEDAVERFNVLERNLGIMAKRPVDPLIISDAVNGFGPAVFWISNPNNIIRDNVAAGSDGSGFWYDLPESPTGLSTDSPIQPRHEPFGEFSGNVSHSNGSFGIFSEFMNPTSGGDLLFDRSIVYKNGFHGVWSEGNGPLFGGGMFVFDNSQFADNRNSIINPGWGRVQNSLFVGESANKGESPLSGNVTGIEFYGGPFGAVNSTFVNYKHDPSRNLYMGAISWKKDLVVGVAHDNYVDRLTFVNSNKVFYQPQPQFFPQNHGIYDASFPYLSFWDKDGSITGTPFGTVSNPHPLINDTSSTYHNDWNAYTSPFSTAQVFFPCGDAGGCQTTLISEEGSGGYIGPDGRTNLPVNKKYKIYRDNSSCNIDISMENQLAGQWIMFEMPYSCTLNSVIRNNSEGLSGYQAVNSVSEVEAANGEKYFYDRTNQRIYFKLYQTRTRSYEDYPGYYRDGIRFSGSGSNVIVSPPSYSHPSPWELGAQQATPSPAPKTGDANGDGRADEIDYGIWLTNYNTNASGGNSVGDFDNNGKVDGIDYVVWLNNSGATLVTPVQTPFDTSPPTPEPTPEATAAPTEAPSPAPATPSPTTRPEAPDGYISQSQAKYVVSTLGNDSNAGTEAAPFRSIQKAADVAQAGDTVVILAGTYNELVRVQNEGTVEAPITFQAEAAGLVVVSGDSAGFMPGAWAGDDSSAGESGNDWVTVKGISFENIGGSGHKVIRMSDGWKLDDVVVRNVPFGANVRGHDVVIEDSLFENINGSDPHAIVGAGYFDRWMQNLQIRNVTIRDVNSSRQATDIGRSAITKFLFTDGLKVDNLLTENNFGPGFWLDWDNKNFTIANSTFRNNSGITHDWEGTGLWLEGNPNANGKVNNNVFEGNSGAGLEIMESNNIEVFGNVFKNNNYCFGLRNMDRGSDRRIENISFHDNLCGNSRYTEITTTIGEWDGWSAAEKNVSFFNNYFVQGNSVPLYVWIGTPYQSLQDAQSGLSVETGSQYVDNGFSLPR